MKCGASCAQWPCGTPPELLTSTTGTEPFSPKALFLNEVVNASSVGGRSGSVVQLYVQQTPAFMQETARAVLVQRGWFCAETWQNPSHAEQGTSLPVRTRAREELGEWGCGRCSKICKICDHLLCKQICAGSLCVVFIFRLFWIHFYTYLCGYFSAVRSHLCCAAPSRAVRLPAAPSTGDAESSTVGTFGTRGSRATSGPV